MRSILLISILLGIFGGAHTVFAIGVPTNLSPDDNPAPDVCSAMNVNFAGLILDWDDVAGVDHYELYYKLETNTNWDDAYPDISQFSLPGLLPDENYEWKVVSCENGDCSLSAVSSPVCTFKTKETGSPLGPVCGNDICESGEEISCPQDCTGGGPGGGGILENPISAQNLTELFNKIFSFLFGLAIFIVPVIVIYAAFLMLMGGGDPVKLQKGRMILMWTAIAFIIILLSRGLPVVFKNLL